MMRRLTTGVLPWGKFSGSGEGACLVLGPQKLYERAAAMSEVRIESDSMGQVEVPSDRYWGAQTQRSLQNFKIGGHRFGRSVIRAFGLVKKAAALTNAELGKI